MEANEAMIEMAKRIGERNTGTFTVHPEHGVRQLDDETISLIRQTAINAALAAIMETQRLDAELVETIRIVGGTLSSWINTNESPMGATKRHIANAIRTGEHYALAGDRHG